MKRSISGISTIVLLLCCCTSTKAQLTDNSSSFRNISNTAYFRFHYDNDFFTKTDEYYSQGITLEYVHPSLKKTPFARLLWKPYTTDPVFGITFNVFGYTPTNLKSDVILFGDRPFSACISLKTFLIQSDAVHLQQVSTAFSIGVIGPAALGKEIQTNIHRWLKNPLPHGWQYQVQNDIVLNYQLNYEKQLFAAGNNFLLNVSNELRVGTLNDKLSGGVNFMAGSFNKKFSPVAHKKRKSEYYLFGQSRMNIIGYDAGIQGGLLNRNNPYQISGKNVSRITFQADAGIIVNFKKIYLSYTQSFLTKEFRLGKNHRWGGLSAGFAL